MTAMLLLLGLQANGNKFRETIRGAPKDKGQGGESGEGEGRKDD